jgi:hypothetical protein
MAGEPGTGCKNTLGKKITRDLPSLAGSKVNVISLPETYEQSRERFHASLGAVQDLWPEARLDSHALPGVESLSIDWINADATEKKEKRLILTTGEHGIEGYVGSAMLQLFVQEYLPRLDPKTTGILLVHCINPWGMKHHRRVNADNIDLNRSFVEDPSPLSAFNPEYELLAPLLNPTRPLKQVGWEKPVFLIRFLLHLARFGMPGLREATLKGQYRHPKGIYFGGQSRPEETGVLMGLYKSTINGYAQMVALDMHTGYGPRRQMTLVNSAWEESTSLETANRFGVPRVAAANPQEFYSIQGDMVDYLYTLMERKFPGTPFYAAAFEFGTFGDSFREVVRAMRTTIFENQFFWYGGSQTVPLWLEHEYTELFAPSAPNWFEKAQADARQAFEGILRAEGYIN